jgi:hypothetical protein
MNEKYVRLPSLSEPPRPRWACGEAATKDSKSRRRCEKSATASYVGMIRNP